MNRNSTIRTSLSYLSEKIHQNDAENGIRIDQLNDLPSLVLTQNLNGETYETWIYAYDGMLCEIMTDLEMDLLRKRVSRFWKSEAFLWSKTVHGSS